MVNMKASSKKIYSILKALKSKNEKVRNKAAVDLVHFQFNNQEPVEPLLDALEDETIDAKYAIIIALGNLRDKGAYVPLLNILQTSEDKDTQNSAAFALGKIGDIRAVEPLLTAFQNQELRWGAGNALGLIGDSRAIEPLIKTLDDELWVGGAIHGLVAFGELAIEPLAKVLHNGSSTARRNAVDTVRQLWFHGKARKSIVKYVVEPLLEVLKDKNDMTRGLAAVMLSEIRDMRGFEPLLEMVKDESSYVRRCLAIGLKDFGDGRAIPALEWMIQNDESWQLVHYDDEIRKEMNRDVAADSLEDLKRKLGQS
jgi:HEAT repeat protein